MFTHNHAILQISVFLSVALSQEQDNLAIIIISGGSISSSGITTRRSGMMIISC